MRETNASLAGAPATTARAMAGWSAWDQADATRSYARWVGLSVSEGRPPISCGLLSRDSNSAMACCSSAGARPLSPERNTCTVIRYDCILRLPAMLIAAALPVDSSVNTVALMVAARARTTMVPSAIPSLTTSESAKERLSIFMEQPPGAMGRSAHRHLALLPFCPFERAQATCGADRHAPQLGMAVGPPGRPFRPSPALISGARFEQARLAEVRGVGAVLTGPACARGHGGARYRPERARPINGPAQGAPPVRSLL